MTVRPEALARTLIARRRVRTEALAAKARDLRAILEEEMQEARSAGLIRRAWLIGSLAGDRFGEASDVDVVTEGLAPESVGALWGRLADSLGADVDLLRWEALPESFRARVLREGVLLAAPRAP